MAESNPLLAALDDICAQRGGSFAIVTADESRNYFAQFLADDAPGLYVEIVGNGSLAPANQLSEVQQDQLRQRGWQGDGEENWSRIWPTASTPADRQRIALDALSTLNDVFGASGEVSVEVSFEGPGGASESWDESENGRPAQGARVALILAAAIAILAIAMGLFLA